ncbi:hypothetical protein AB9E29_05025 [Rhizobium leguminosarum]|uniref:hypothetical protein n=1 Tax=Rhizobium leguminosarum TaxID=384 RepID=UPI003F9C6DD2
MVAFNIVAVNAQGKAIGPIFHVTPETGSNVTRQLAGAQVVVLDNRLRVGSPSLDVPSDIGTEGKSIFDVVSEAYERYRERGDAPEIDDSVTPSPAELEAAERELGYDGSGLKSPEEYGNEEEPLPPKEINEPEPLEPEEPVEPSRKYDGRGTSSGEGASRGGDYSGGNSSPGSFGGPGTGGFGSAGGGDSGGGGGDDDDLGHRRKTIPT